MHIDLVNPNSVKADLKKIKLNLLDQVLPTHGIANIFSEKFWFPQGRESSLPSHHYTRTPRYFEIDLKEYQSLRIAVVDAEATEGFFAKRKFIAVLPQENIPLFVDELYNKITLKHPYFSEIKFPMYSTRLYDANLYKYQEKLFDIRDYNTRSAYKNPKKIKSLFTLSCVSIKENVHKMEAVFEEYLE